MSSIDGQLERLFHAARQAAGPDTANPPFGLETRALAAWRGSFTTPVEFWDAAVLMRGMIAAGVLALICLAPTLSAGFFATSYSEVLQLTNSTVSTDGTP